jgi:hypothetical protein
MDGMTVQQLVREVFAALTDSSKGATDAAKQVFEQHWGDTLPSPTEPLRLLTITGLVEESRREAERLLRLTSPSNSV